MRTSELVDFIIQRDARRPGSALAKLRKPDAILDTYRFCNVRRNDDRVTKWLFKKWYPPFAEDKDLWFSAVVARLFNLPDSLDAIQAYILPMKPTRLLQVLGHRARTGVKNFNAAYIVSTNGWAMDKVEYVVSHVLTPMWAARKTSRPSYNDTLEGYHAELMKFQGMGSFMAAQVIADLKYVDEKLEGASDFYTWAASGPGSRRGLNRVKGRPVETPWPEFEWFDTLTALRSEVCEELKRRDARELYGIMAQDLQNCLCEFDKYERARLSEGRPKQLYKPHQGE